MSHRRLSNQVGSTPQYGFLMSTVVVLKDMTLKPSFLHSQNFPQLYLQKVINYFLTRYRGDGRTYKFNIHPKTEWDPFWFDIHQFPLYTRGGPYWSIAKIPLSAFFVTNRGSVIDRQGRISRSRVRMISFTLADRVPGPFALEIDYIALYYDQFHREKFAYEQYDAPAILK